MIVMTGLEDTLLDEDRLMKTTATHIRNLYSHNLIVRDYDGPRFDIILFRKLNDLKRNTATLDTDCITKRRGDIQEQVRLITEELETKGGERFVER